MTIVSSTIDLCHAESDKVAYHVVRERLIDTEPDRSLGKVEPREPVTDLIDRRRTERETLRWRFAAAKPSSGFCLSLSAAIP